MTGLAVLTYIPRTRIVIYEYIALKDQYRINAVLFAYASLIQNYMSAKSFDIAYYLVEISNRNDGKSVDKESRLFKKLICLEGFGRVNAKYQTLPLGLDHHESSFNAYIYLKANDTIDTISKQTFLSIIHSICYDYYLSWYSSILTPEELRSFRDMLDRCYKSQEEKISGEVQFEVEYVDCALLGNLHIDKSFGLLPSSNKRNFGKYPLIILLVFLGSPLLFGAYYYFFKILGIPINALSNIGGIFASIAPSVTTFLLVDKKKI